VDEIPSHLRGYGVPVRKRPVQGRGELQLVFVRRGDPRLLSPTPSGRSLPVGIPIQELRSQLGGNEGLITTPTGERYKVTIPPEYRDDDDVMVLLQFRFVDEDRARRRSGP
jgi:hypothetical protein